MATIDLKSRALSGARLPTRVLRQLRQWHLRISPRMAWVMAIGSSVLLVGMIVLWLTLATRTALLSKQLEDLEAQDQQLVEQINNKWTVIGEMTNQQKMGERASAAGFHAADKADMAYLIEVTPTVTQTGAGAATTGITSTTVTTTASTASTTATNTTINTLTTTTPTTENH